jgi:hypothetical protein
MVHKIVVSLQKNIRDIVAVIHLAQSAVKTNATFGIS